MCAALAAISVMTMMMTTNQGGVPDALSLDKPGIVIRAPHDLSPAGVIPLKIDVEADMRTDDALRGFLIEAVSLALVRQDRPGVFLDAAYNPHQIGYPLEAIGEDGVAYHVPAVPLGDPRDTTGRMVEYDLGQGFVDRGSGRYFLLGGFAKWWAAPQVISIRDLSGPAPADQRPLPVAAVAIPPSAVPPTTPILAIGKLGGRRFLRVKLPPTEGGHAAQPAKGEKPFFTIVGFHLQTHGGSVGGVFAPQIAAGTTPVGIEATVSFASFASFDRARMNRREIPGHWVFLLFYDDQVSEPINVTLAKTDY